MRSSHNQDVIRSVVRILPDEAARRGCVAVFVEAIAFLHACNPGIWGVYCTPDRIRLVCGNLIVHTLKQSSAWLCLDRESIDASPAIARRLDDIPAWKWDQKVYPTYKPINSRNGYYSPTLDRQNGWPTIRTLHHISLRRAAAHYHQLNVRTQRNHQPELLAYFRSEHGLAVPTPTYLAGSRIATPKPSTSQSDFLPEQLVSSSSLAEGAKTQVTVNAYERNPYARRICVEYFGAICAVCSFDFGKTYGELADGLIHVHHLTPLSQIRESYQVDPIEDLRPVCPNCHAVIHRRDPPLTIAEVKHLLHTARSSSEAPKGIRNGGIVNEAVDIHPVEARAPHAVTRTDSSSAPETRTWHAMTAGTKRLSFDSAGSWSAHTTGLTSRPRSSGNDCAPRDHAGRAPPHLS